jgi:hypothetical protein
MSLKIQQTLTEVVKSPAQDEKKKSVGHIEGCHEQRGNYRDK